MSRGRILIAILLALAAAAAGFFLAARMAQAHYPQISPIPDVQIEINQATPLMRFIVSDRETDADDLRVSARSDNPALVPNDDDHIELGGDGDTRWILVTPLSDKTGFATVTVTLTDGDGDQSQEPFRVIVREPPNM